MSVIQPSKNSQDLLLNLLTTPHALVREIPHPRGLGFLLHGQNQCSNSTGLTSHLSDGTVLQIRKPVTKNSLTNKMKNIKRNKMPYIPIAKARGFTAKERQFDGTAAMVY